MAADARAAQGVDAVCRRRGTDATLRQAAMSCTRGRDRLIAAWSRKTGSMYAKIVISVVLGALLGAVAAIAVFPEAREALFPQSSTQSSGKALIGGPFTLSDASGKKITDA